MSPEAQPYRERLSAPLSYWAIGLAVGVVFTAFASIIFGPVVMAIAVAGCVAIVAATLLYWGALEIVVDGSGLRAGRSLLEWPYVGAVTAIDAEVRAAGMRQQDAHLAIRPYAEGTLVVEVEDAADPHRWWMISTRHPARLVRAIRQHRPAPIESAE